MLDDTNKYLVGAFAGVALKFLFDATAKFFQSRDERTQMATALFHELCDRASRCSYDYGFPFSKYAYPSRREDRMLDDVIKFSPTPPLAFPSSVDKLGVYPSNVTATLIVFYSSLERWGRELELATKLYNSTTIIPNSYMNRLSSRLGETLLPAMDALDALAPLVPNSGRIESSYFEAYFRKDAPSQLQRHQTSLKGSLVAFSKLASDSKTQKQQSK